MYTTTTLTFFISEYFIVKEISLDVHALEFVDFGVDELSEVLEVQQFHQEVFHIRTRLKKPGQWMQQYKTITTRNTLLSPETHSCLTYAVC